MAQKFVLGAAQAKFSQIIGIEYKPQLDEGHNCSRLSTNTLPSFYLKDAIMDSIHCSGASVLKVKKKKSIYFEFKAYCEITIT